MSICATPADAASWASLPIPQVTAPNGAFEGVSCVTATDCVGVGSTIDDGGVNRPLAERLDGRSWRVMTLPPLDSYGGILPLVSCAGPAFCMAIGTGRLNLPFAFAWVRGRWRSAALPRAGYAPFLFRSLSCPRPGDCQAVGLQSNGQPLAARFQRSRWTLEQIPQLAPPNAQPPAVATELTGISCTSGSSCVAVGFTNSATGTSASARFDGHRWIAVPLPDLAGASASALNGVSCAGPNACIAVGYYTAGPSGAAVVALAERWDGVRWQITSTPPVAATNVSCPRADWCVAAGTTGGLHPQTLVESFDGGGWRLLRGVLTPAGTFGLDVSCAAVGACVAVGSTSEGDVDALAISERLQAGRWDALPATGAVGAVDNSLYGLSCPRTRFCVAVGVLRTQSAAGAAALVLRFDGTGWTRERPRLPADARLKGVSCARRSLCVAVGAYTTADGREHPLTAIRTRHGWRRVRAAVPAGATGQLTAVSCASPAFCMAVGSTRSSSLVASALVERWDGSRWRLTPGSLDRTPAAVSCTSATLCMAVGDSNSAERWDGSVWRAQMLPTSPGSDFYDVSCSATATRRGRAESCMAVGGIRGPESDRYPASVAVSAHWDGTRWSAPATPYAYSLDIAFLAAVSCRTPTACEALGGGEVFAEAWDGRGWGIQPTPADLTAAPATLSCPSAAECIATSNSALFTTIGRAGVDQSVALRYS